MPTRVLRSRTVLRITLVLLGLTFCFGIALAAAGDLDNSFSGDGKVTTDVASDDRGNALAIQPDGKIVVAAEYSTGSDYDFALLRYNHNGSLDDGFGDHGKVLTRLSSGGDIVYGIAIQADGKIVAAGYSDNGSNADIALVRYNSDGSADTSFGGGDGIVTTSIGTSHYDAAYALAIQPDGKIVAAGISYKDSNYQFAVARYDVNGNLDTSFHADGMVVTSVDSYEDEAFAIAVQPDGKIVVAGYTNAGVGHNQFAAARYNPNGTLDTSFGTNGKLTVSFGTLNDQTNKALAMPFAAGFIPIMPAFRVGYR